VLREGNERRDDDNQTKSALLGHFSVSRELSSVAGPQGGRLYYPMQNGGSWDLSRDKFSTAFGFELLRLDEQDAT
jgi:hypothetical protein